MIIWWKKQSQDLEASVTGFLIGPVDAGLDPDLPAANVFFYPFNDVYLQVWHF